jgi:hypothetical protein
VNTETLDQIEELTERIARIEKSIESRVVFPDRWIFLPEAAALKGVKYNTISTRAYHWMQPENGVPDAVINGRKAWRPEKIARWILQDDATLLQMAIEKGMDVRRTS